MYIHTTQGIQEKRCSIGSTAEMKRDINTFITCKTNKYLYMHIILNKRNKKVFKKYLFSLYSKEKVDIDLYLYFLYLKNRLP